MRKTGGSAARLFGVVVRPFQAFMELEAASGILLLACAVGALVWANLDPGTYATVFDLPLTVGAGAWGATFTVRTLVNDGLMTIFFFVVGMEIKRELVSGELDTAAKASLPAIAALGGMVLPAGIYLVFNLGGPGQVGWGIPMATDIAFCIGLLTILKTRVPHSLVVFVTALAIFDDIGGILVIALFYGHGISVEWLLAAALLVAILYAMSRAYVTSGLVYGLVGAGLWLAFHHGGVHATIAGVVLGLLIPARPRRPAHDVLRELAEHVGTIDRNTKDDELAGAQVLMIEEKLEDLQAPLGRFVHALHPLVAFVIMPVFALANSGVSLAGVGVDTLTAPIAAGAAVGLFVGKQLGIFSFTLLAVRLRVAPMPRDTSVAKLYGASVIAGIGFTVALFIATLAFAGAGALLGEAKLGILVGSFVSGVVGFLILRLTRPVARG